MKFTIDLSLPPKALSPNARPHWRTKANATKKYRRLAGLLALAALNGQDPPRLKTATARLTFTFPDHPSRQRDHDNLAASMKAAWDGLADAGILDNDRGLTHLPLQIVQGQKGVRIEIEA